MVNHALDLGVTLFDTSPVYGAEAGASEEALGRALGQRRKDAVIVTKFGIPIPLGTGAPPDTSRAAVIKGAEASLRRLNTDYIDIFMQHVPDSTTPPEETLRALDDLVSSGKVRYIGCSNLPAWRFVESRWISKTERLAAFIVSQNEYSLAQREPETGLIPALAEYGAGFMPYAPLANGLLTGKFSADGPVPPDTRLGKNLYKTGDRYLTPDRLRLADSLRRFASEHGHSLLELAVSWLLSHPIVCSVIAGASNVQQLESNIAASGWHLGPDELDEVDRICRDSRAV
jgi:aryl-alcohol dehydrogenase-like predicted oxidoreductase